jgi:hypothetical protein
MKEKLTTKSIIAIAIPLTTIGIQWLLRDLAKSEFNSIGITLASIGIGQIFPFIVFENFLLSKVFSLKEEKVISNNQLILTYKVESNDKNNLKDIRLLSYLFLLINILLFIATVSFSLQGNFKLHLLTGFISCGLAWYYTIKL